MSLWAEKRSDFGSCSCIFCMRERTKGTLSVISTVLETRSRSLRKSTTLRMKLMKLCACMMSPGINCSSSLANPTGSPPN